jgi:hypothetical protein
MMTTMTTMTTSTMVSLLGTVAILVLGLLLALPFLALLLLIFWFWRPFPVSPNVPGPPLFPGLGLLWFPMRHWSNWPTVCYETSQTFHHATWGGPCLRYGAIFFTDRPVNLKHILKDNFSNYEKGAVWRSVFGEILGHGIFNADGAVWASHRKISAKLFSPNLCKHQADTSSKQPGSSSAVTAADESRSSARIRPDCVCVAISHIRFVFLFSSFFFFFFFFCPQ